MLLFFHSGILLGFGFWWRRRRAEEEGKREKKGLSLEKKRERREKKEADIIMKQIPRLIVYEQFVRSSSCLYVALAL